MHLTNLPFVHPELEGIIHEVATAIATKFEQEPGPEYRRGPDTRNSRFGAGTNGAMGRDVTIPLHYIEGTGTRFVNEALGSAVFALTGLCYEQALDAFLRDNPEVALSTPREDVDYHLLYEAGKGSLAEELSEYESEALDEHVVTIRVGVFFYAPGNRNHGRTSNPDLGELQFWVSAFLDDGCVMGPGPSSKSVTLWESTEVLENPMKPYTGPRSTLPAGFDIFAKHAPEKV